MSTVTYLNSLLNEIWNLRLPAILFEVLYILHVHVKQGDCGKQSIVFK